MMDPRIKEALDYLHSTGRAAKVEINKAKARLAKPNCSQESKDFLEHRVKMKQELRDQIAAKLREERKV